ncbi:MAG: hypothetical protein UV56_C0001G0012 [Candidatus Woesebacteria bacterium GW2011_GWC1_43_10b]|uniref:Fibronectin type-III domain-containing protein n=3 Tax=Candidatus Woeseibacteriota TaxID=1752722 RepID=A0A0G0PJM5_9BACT|nr:MAG: hypothetical protein UT23_C0004G0125 [Candidatus Woesebacteria bacterium GW2011_GWA1_39_12]KKR01083.1 MAG: hypothetical protein UT24_C0007G0047 [Candidatus Woesebacteria bacterium GW2011_GWB1_39_12]KKS81070.1 MAG: hypothetical protein UV56_C0001G0012 [Candidatus Woesebacteria bacterium GW2011_GWC1_43_10b]
MKNKFFKQGVITALLLLTSVFLGRIFGYEAFAESSVTPPSFPTCSEKIFVADGDWAHYDSGIHGIPGVGNFEGSDDVYSLGSGNFLQCFCPAGGGEGTQTNWWDVENLNQEDINSFLSQSWFFESSGDGWNLLDDPYLVKNSNFSCAVPTPTPPPSGGGGGGSPGAPVCNAPAVTKAPLYSSANLSRIDSDSIKISWIVTDDRAQRYGIYYGTNSDKLSWYTEVKGHDTNEAIINLVPQGNIFFKVCSIGECGDQVCGSDIPTVLGVAKGLPATGTIALTILVFAPIGYYLYRRFRLV